MLIYALHLLNGIFHKCRLNIETPVSRIGIPSINTGAYNDDLLTEYSGTSSEIIAKQKPIMYFLRLPKFWRMKN